MSTPVENCQNCAFGQDAFGNFGGQCRRHSPTVFMARSGGRYEGGALVETYYSPAGQWPPVTSLDFCGDFELKDASDH